MPWWQAGLWGALGSTLVELADLRKSVQERRRLPWQGRGAASLSLYVLAGVLRTALGIGVAVALAESGQVSGGFGAVLSGIAAPRILEALQSQAAPGLLAAPPDAPAPRPNTALPHRAQPAREAGSTHDTH
ncbi:hypothetical protein GCM10009665_39570 [Kitasatospora nipponensis]|uniref:Uncharacterized protein n=1 Tax=Kitasatospora nipponensis TaxID=258049 RepID=A0ABP4H461_9ACTN